MFTPQETALLDYLTRYFDRLLPTEEPVERSLKLLVRAMASVLASDMGARGLPEPALAEAAD